MHLYQVSLELKRVEGKLEPATSPPFLKELVMAMLAFGGDDDKVLALRLCESTGLDIGEITAAAFSGDLEDKKNLRPQRRCVGGRQRGTML